MILCDTGICNAGWHMDFLLPPLTTIPTGTWKCALCPPRYLLPQTATRHIGLPSPILDFASDLKKKKRIAITKTRFWTTHYHSPKNCTSKHFHPNSSPIPTCRHISRGPDLKPRCSTWLSMGGLGPCTLTVFCFGFFPCIFCSMGIGLCGPGEGGDWWS